MDRRFRGGAGVTDPTLFRRYSVTQVYSDRGPFPTDTSRLISQLYAQRADANSYFSAGILSFESLRAAVIDNAQRPAHRQPVLRHQRRIPDRSGGGGALGPGSADPWRPPAPDGVGGGALSQQPGDRRQRPAGPAGCRTPAIQLSRAPSLFRARPATARLRRWRPPPIPSRR